MTKCYFVLGTVLSVLHAFFSHLVPQQTHEGGIIISIYRCENEPQKEEQIDGRSHGSQIGRGAHWDGPLRHSLFTPYIFWVAQSLHMCFPPRM